MTIRREKARERGKKICDETFFLTNQMRSDVRAARCNSNILRGSQSPVRESFELLIESTAFVYKRV